MDDVNSGGLKLQIAGEIVLLWLGGPLRLLAGVAVRAVRAPGRYVQRFINADLKVPLI